MQYRITTYAPTATREIEYTSRTAALRHFRAIAADSAYRRIVISRRANATHTWAQVAVAYTPEPQPMQGQDRVQTYLNAAQPAHFDYTGRLNRPLIDPDNNDPF